MSLDNNFDNSSLKPNLEEHLSRKERIPSVELDDNPVNFIWHTSGRDIPMQMRAIKLPWGSVELGDYRIIFGLYSLIEDGEPKPVGYADFVYLGDESYALLPFFKKPLDEYNENLDEGIERRYSQVAAISNHPFGIVDDPQYRGKHLGQIFLALCLHSLNKHGITYCGVSNDITREKDPEGKNRSFYTHLSDSDDGDGVSLTLEFLMKTTLTTSQKKLLSKSIKETESGN